MVFFAQEFDVSFYFVGNMRHHLNRFAQIVAAPFFIDYRFVNPSRGERIGFSSFDVGKPLVMPEVEIGFHTVYRNITFAVLVRIERARVDVDVGVELLNGNVISSCLEELTNRRGDDALTQ